MKKWIPVLLLFLWACSPGEEKASNIEGNGEEKRAKAKNINLLPDASGEYGEMVIVMDKDRWEGELGLALREVFHSDVPGLARREPFFTTRVIEPFQFNKIFKAAKNLVYVTSFDSGSPADRWLQNTFTEDAKTKAKTDPSLFMSTAENQYAKGQKVLRLFGKDQATLIANLDKNKQILRNYFNIAERQRLASELKMTSATRMVVRGLRDKFGYTIKIPGAYELAISEEDFMWARYLPPVGASKNLFVYFKDYESQDEFSHENVIKLRNEIGKQYIFGDPNNPESYMTTEMKYVPISQRNISFDGKYTVETKGAWKTNNLSVGGSFVSYTFLDETTNRLYYIEGFVIHPNEEHRELIREMESLLTTFRNAS
mgnify:CR=1 FL=1